MKKADAAVLFEKLMENILVAWDGIFPWEIPIEYDDSQYTVVDGEEGDYGLIKYYHVQTIERRKVCEFVNKGGDNKDYIFTKYGVDLFTPFVYSAVSRNMLREYP